MPFEWPSVSIVIRACNEAQRLRNLLDCIANQKYRGEKEVIVVDNQSKDDTVWVADRMGAKVVTLEKNQFTFPRSMNMGAAVARNDIILMTVAHALPINLDWLSSGMRHFADPQVGGVYSPVIPHTHFGYPKRTLAEIFYYMPGYLAARIRGPHAAKPGIGVFGGTNCALRRRDWLIHHFDERFECGGEDGEMARWLIFCGKKIVCDTGFAVYHSHGLDFRGMVEQHKYWSQLSHYTKFSRDLLFFRKDMNFQ